MRFGKALMGANGMRWLTKCGFDPHFGLEALDRRYYRTDKGSV
jgi:hypothetical protein